MPAAALIGRLRAAIPPSTAVELVFDGPPDPGLRGERIASGVVVRYSGRRTGDEVIIDTVANVGRATAERLVVVTDDRELGGAVRARGARTAGTAWLLGRLERPRLASPSVGNRRPPSTPPATPAADDPDRDPWQPGRGATTKRGNPRRRRRSSGSMPS